MDNNLEFSFGETGDIFSGFNADLSSLQKQDDPVVNEIEEEEKKKIEEGEVSLNEDQDSDDDIVVNDENELDDGDGDDGDNSDDNDDSDSDHNSSDTDVDNISYKAIADYLSESGVLDSLDDYDGEDSPEALEIAVKKTVDGLVKSYKESIPEEGKRFLDYIEKGGDPSKFFKSLESDIDFKNLDLENESTQKQVYKEFLESIGYTPDEIEEELNDAEDNLLLEKKAKTAAKKLEKIYQERQENLIKEQEQAAIEAQLQYEEYIKSINNTIETSTQLAGIPVTPSEKTEFQKYLLQTGSDGMTQYQREINEDPVKTQLELAYLKFKKYDFSKVSKQIQTQETRRIKNIIKNSDKVNSRSPQVTKSKAGDLSAFKSQFM